MLNPIAALKQTVRIFFMSFADLWKIKMAVVTFFACLAPITFSAVTMYCETGKFKFVVTVVFFWPIATSILTLLVVCAANLQFLREKPRGQKITWAQMGNFIWKRLLILLSDGFGLGIGFICGSFMMVFVDLLRPSFSTTAVALFSSTLLLFISSISAMGIAVPSHKFNNIYQLIYCLVFWGLLCYAAVFLVQSRFIPISQGHARCPANPWELAVISAAALTLMSIHMIATLVRLQKENA